MQYQTLSATEYSTTRYNFVVNVEENGDPKELAYADSVGIPTIGVGFNLRVENTRDRVLTKLGFGLDPKVKGVGDK